MLWVQAKLFAQKNRVASKDDERSNSIFLYLFCLVYDEDVSQYA